MSIRKEEIRSVCLLVSNIDALTGGIQKNSKLLLAELNRRGIETYVCSRNYLRLPLNETKEGTRYHRSPVIGTWTVLNAVLYFFDSLSWLIGNRRKYDLIHCQQMFGPTMVAAVAKYFVKKPILTRVTLSGDTGEVSSVRKMPLAGLRLRLLKQVSKWVALTHEMKYEIESLEVPATSICVINNATDLPDEMAFEEETKRIQRNKLSLGFKKIAVFFGRLSSEKRLDTLISAWRVVNERHPDAHLLICGEGGDFRNVEDELRTLVIRFGLGGNVHFLGFVPNPKDYVLACDAFVLPSNAEGMSNSLVEAFACGASIVASDIAANREICENEVNSLLVEVGNDQKWAEAILRILDSPVLARKLGESARKKAEAELTVDQMVERYLDAYNEIVFARRC